MNVLWCLLTLLFPAAVAPEAIGRVAAEPSGTWVDQTRKSTLRLCSPIYPDSRIYRQQPYRKTDRLSVTVGWEDRQFDCSKAEMCDGPLPLPGQKDGNTWAGKQFERLKQVYQILFSHPDTYSPVLTLTRSGDRLPGVAPAGSDVSRWRDLARGQDNAVPSAVRICPITDTEGVVCSEQTPRLGFNAPASAQMAALAPGLYQMESLERRASGWLGTEDTRWVLVVNAAHLGQAETELGAAETEFRVQLGPRRLHLLIPMLKLYLRSMRDRDWSRPR